MNKLSQHHDTSSADACQPPNQGTSSASVWLDDAVRFHREALLALAARGRTEGWRAAPPKVPPPVERHRCPTLGGTRAEPATFSARHPHGWGMLGFLLRPRTTVATPGTTAGSRP